MIPIALVRTAALTARDMHGLKLGLKPSDGISSPQATAISMLVNLVGAGFVSLPWCLSRASIVPGLVLLAAFCVLNALSALIICACAERTHVYSFVKLGSVVVGPGFGRFVQLVTALNTAGTCISYGVLICDFAPHALEGLGAPDDAWYASRAFVIGLAAVCILLPLSAQRDLSRLRYSSALAFGGILFSLSVIVWRAMAAPNADAPVPAVRFSTGVIAAAPVFNVSFLMHYNAPRFYQELRGRSLRKMAGIVAAVFGLAFTLYTTLGLSGIIAFGAEVDGDVINNLKSTGTGLEHDMALVVRLAMTVIMSLTFPLAMHSLRTATCALLVSPDTAERYSTPITALLVTLVCVVAWAFSDVTKVLSYKGALFSTILVYVYPAITYYYLRAPRNPAATPLDLEGVGLVSDSHPKSYSQVAVHDVTNDEVTEEQEARPGCCSALARVRAGTAFAIAWGLGVMVLGVLKASGMLH